MIFVARRGFNILKTFDCTGLSLFTRLSVVCRGSRFSFRNNLSGIEKMALKTVITRIFLCLCSAVTANNQILVAHIIVVDIVPAERVQTNLRDAFRNRYPVKIVAAEECRFTDSFNALAYGKVG